MKRIFLILTIITGLGLAFSCTKDTKDPVLDMSLATKPAFTAPVDASSFVLTKAGSENVMADFTWTPTVYNLANLSNIKYILQMDVVDNSFSNPLTLVSSESTNFSINVGTINQKLVGQDLATDVAHNIYFRVVSFVNNKEGYENLNSDVLTLSITHYSDVVIVKTLYLLGDATTAQWDNNIALPFTYVSGSTFSIVTTLEAGKFMKVISRLGSWAPQWGTDATGTSSGGILVYRPDEATADPAGIPSPDVSGEYKITVDTAALTYTIGTPNPELFMLGDGSPAGWDNSLALPMNGTGGNYTLTLDLAGGGFLKFITTLGQWAPMYGTDETGTSAGGPLVYRPDEATTDPPSIPAPTEPGTYTINVNTVDLTYTIE